MAVKKVKKQTPFMRQKTLSVGQLIIFAIFFGLIGGLIVLKSFAAPGGGKGGGKPGSGGTGTISLAMVADNNSDGLPNWNERVRFVVATTASQPRVRLLCYQNGTLVSQSTEGYFSGALDDGIFGLASPMWTSGAADCTARLYALDSRNRESTLATLDFHVNP